MTNILTILGVCLGCLVAVALTAVRLPGTWGLVGGTGICGWLTNWRAVSFGTLALLSAIAVFGEVAELITSAVATRGAGGSKRAAWGALIGGVLGMLFLSFLVPVPVVGSMIGALAGCFAGGAVAELSYRRSLAQGTRVGLFAALGLAAGTAAKVGLALVMSAIVLRSALVGPTQDNAASQRAPAVLRPVSDK